jgi:hypothetical protein
MSITDCGHFIRPRLARFNRARCRAVADCRALRTCSGIEPFAGVN